jgi:hypothetical protein
MVLFIFLFLLLLWIRFSLRIRSFWFLFRRLSPKLATSGRSAQKTARFSSARRSFIPII